MLIKSRIVRNEIRVREPQLEHIIGLYGDHTGMTAVLIKRLRFCHSGRQLNVLPSDMIEIAADHVLESLLCLGRRSTARTPLELHQQFSGN